MSTNSPPPGDALNSPDFSGRTGGDDVNENSGGGINGGKCKNNSFMLFGVRITEGSNPNPIRKSVSLSNLSQYKKLHESNHDVVAAGYASDDVVHKSTGIRDRKRGTPWTEEEHRLFLLGLQKVGKGDWRGISRNFVKTRTPTQVASHAQKYFIRRTNLNRRRRRSSLFDMTTEEENLQKLQADHQSNSSSGMILPVNGISIEPLSDQTKTHMKVINSIPLFPVPPSTRMNDLNLNSKSTESSSFNLVTSLDHDHKPKQQQQQTTPSSSSSTVINSGFQVKNSLTNGGGGDIDLNNVIRVS